MKLSQYKIQNLFQALYLA